MEIVGGSADQSLITKWDEKLRACSQDRLSFEHQWHQNMAFYFGRQYITSSKSSNGSYSLIDQPATDAWRVRHTANRVLRIIRTEVTKLSKEEPQFYCLPKSTEESDRLAAMAGDSIAEFILRTKYFNRKRLEATFWACLCGTSYIKNYYSPTALEIDGLPGKIDFDVVTAFHLFVPNLQATEMEQQPYVIHAMTRDAEMVYNDYGVEVEPDTDSSNLISDSRFLSSIGLKNTKSRENKQVYVKEIYVKKCKEFPNGAMFTYGGGQILYVYEPPEDPMAQFEGEFNQPSLFDPEEGGNPLESLTSGMAGVGPSMQPVGPPISDEPPVGTYGPESLPKSIHPGLGNYSHEYPFRHGRFPFAKIDHVPTGMWYSESVIKSLIPLQKEYNRTRSIMLENRNLAGKPQWYYPLGSIDPKKFTSKPGLMLPVPLGFDPPRPLEQPQLPPSTSNELDVILRDMDDASSQFEVSKGRTPPGVEAASAIAYLSEENDTILFHTVQSLENAVQETGVQVLANAHDYWPAERMVRMTSKNQFLEVREFCAQDLNPIMDFRVESGSMAPRSLAAKQAFITELYKTGAIEPRQALKYLQMSETNKLYDELMIDERHVQRENVIMSGGKPLYQIDPQGEAPVDPMTGQPQMGPDGMPMPAYKKKKQLDPMTGKDMIDPATGEPIEFQVTVNGYDAHEIHVVEHQKFQKTQEYELLSPEIKQIIQNHVDEHKMEMLQERNAIQANAAYNQESEPTPPPREEMSNNGSGAGIPAGIRPDGSA